MNKKVSKRVYTSRNNGKERICILYGWIFYTIYSYIVSCIYNQS